GCFLALAGLAGLAAASGGPWLLRLPLLAATPLLAIGVWWQLSLRDGWPAGAPPADRSPVVARLRRSPTPGGARARFLLAPPPGTSTRRAYRLPYSPDLERQVARAAHDAKKGTRVAVGFKRTDRRRGKNGPKAALRFYRLPPTGVQVKEHAVASAG